MFEITQYPIAPDASGQSSYRLKIVIAHTDQGDPNVFVYQAAEIGDSRGDGWFSCVANASQMGEYPTKAGFTVDPDPKQNPFYRDNEIDLIGRNANDLKELSEEIVFRIKMLVKSLNLLAEADGSTPTVTVV